MLTRNKEQILLNEIHALCIEAADHYQAAASKTCVADMKSVFLDAKREHEEFAAELATYIHKQNDQPKLPDPDRETVELFLMSVKAKLAGSEKQAVMDDQAKMEKKLCEVIPEALESGLPTDVKQLLERIFIKANAMQYFLSNQ